ncbi:MAG: metallopeptidase family protein [Chloroflexi bacterium]|nr:metallopeptidase family protein [Chloroflexota bacterium]
MDSPIRQIREARLARRARFEALVRQAVAGLPEEFRARLENVDILVEDWPSFGQLARMGLRSRYQLLGLYEGVPLTVRGGGYNMVTPDKVTIFRKPLEAMCRSDEEIAAEVQRVIRHEIAHHFGISDQRLRAIENPSRSHLQEPEQLKGER